MKRRVTWKAGSFVILKLRDDLFTVAKMLGSSVMCFYNVSRKDDNWSDVDWTGVRPIFKAFVGNVVLNRLGWDKVNVDGIVFASEEISGYWIKPYTSMDVAHYPGGKGDFSFMGGRLIDLGPSNDLDTSTAPVLKHDLKIPYDRDLIEKYELTNMWGDQDLSDRLCRYFDTGVNRDDLKFEVFPELWNDREQLRPLTRRLPVPLR